MLVELKMRGRKQEMQAKHLAITAYVLHTNYLEIACVPGQL
jgi:hypothetical protein